MIKLTIHRSEAFPAKFPRTRKEGVRVDDTPSHLSRLGAQTIARFLLCMLVMQLKAASRERCRIRNSRVLKIKGLLIQTTNDTTIYSENFCFSSSLESQKENQQQIRIHKGQEIKFIANAVVCCDLVSHSHNCA